jgi:multimeric flavodoxin WrbA
VRFGWAIADQEIGVPRGRACAFEKVVTNEHNATHAWLDASDVPQVPHINTQSETREETMKVLGVSGSPVPNSNTDRALRTVLDATGFDTEFIKLSEWTVAPCRACLRCVETNRCVIEDDGIMLAEKAREADALIVAGYTPYASLDARTKAFLERLYPLRHKRGFMRGKPGAALITCTTPANATMLPPASMMGIDAIRFYMMEEGMDFVGSVRIEGNVPCMTCGHGDDCEMSAVKMLHGADATVASIAFQCFEEQHEAARHAKWLGEEIARRLRAL